MLKRCTFCRYYNIHTVYRPEDYDLPLSTICEKLQWPRMYKENEDDSDPTWGFKKDCNLYERAKNLNKSMSKKCDEWEELSDRPEGVRSSKPEHTDKIEQAKKRDDQEQRSKRINNEESSKGKRPFMATGYRAKRIAQERANPIERVYNSLEANQFSLPCSKADS